MPPPLPPGLTPGPTSTPRGRTVHATQTFAPGSTIAEFTDQDPSHPAPCIAIPDTPSLARTCSYCLAVAAPSLPLSFPFPIPGSSSSSGSGGGNNETKITLRTCTGCNTTRYCTPTCQKSDWALAHGKGECKAFKRVNVSLAEMASLLPPRPGGGPVNLPTPIRALIQVLVRPEMKAAVEELEGHLDSIDARTGEGTKPEEMVLQAQGALHYLGREMTSETIAVAIGITCKLQVNAFNRRDEDTGQSGMYVSPGLSMINHSCMPNAFVQFVGRKAVLHAIREIKAGEEVEISYIDTTLHLAQRQRGMKQYFFKCTCLRCERDLDIYQVCQTHPHLELNSFSLTPDLDKLRNPPIKQNLNSSKDLQAYIDQIYPICKEPLPLSNPSGNRQQLRQRWNMCKQLRDTGLYAIEPIPFILVEASLCLVEAKNLASSLVITCFLVLDVEPYRNPVPFSQLRVRGMMTLAQLLTNTDLIIKSYKSKGVGGALAGRITEVLSKMDQVTICRVVLEMVVHYCPAAHSGEWQIYHKAKEMLDDTKNLAGRDTEDAMIDAFFKNPKGLEEKRFFETTVLEPLKAIAGFFPEVMDAEFGA
ncbi:uncharacterized protein F4822DRAFT_443188 [Hypoxylon trugodes]|uniref:uncharacterized protein n=1 Tax=Hypoxylon trugodes TaxID=326681 RepID=UPI002195BC3E|nr:uncharacterized protein F4822DRAFT_443188 [Hypoxylon trugodes]KAI1390262.1 hypothetical protein F4822DRAFT_443188 [Hypoxylon trugodes]